MVEDMFERPNLKENHKTLEFSTQLELGTELNNLIKAKGTLVGESYVFAESYTIARAKHMFTIQFAFSRTSSIESRKPVLETEVTFKSLLVPGAKVQKSFSSPNDIIRALNKIRTINMFNCSLTYDYKNQDKKKFILSLPIKVIESPIFPFQTIDGVSILGKTQNIDYSALVVNYPILKITHLLIMFHKNYHFHNHIAESIINDGNMIVNKLMVGSGG